MEAEDIYFCPKSSYYFRCDVIKCSHLKWEVSGSVVQTIFPYTPTSDVVPRDPLNILIQNISRGDIEEETNFTSYLWFNSSSYPPEGSSTTVQITCRSLQSSKTINLRHPGILLASSPGSFVGGEKSLVHTACAALGYCSSTSV